VALGTGYWSAFEELVLKLVCSEMALKDETMITNIAINIHYKLDSPHSSIKIHYNANNLHILLSSTSKHRKEEQHCQLTCRKYS
jgi:hypothetical protein